MTKQIQEKECILIRCNKFPYPHHCTQCAEFVCYNMINKEDTHCPTCQSRFVKNENGKFVVIKEEWVSFMEDKNND